MFNNRWSMARVSLTSLCIATAVLFMAGCASAGQDGSVAAPAPVAASAGALDYRLGVADKVRVTVFNEPTLSGEFPINADGSIALPLIGNMVAAGMSATDLQKAVEAKLSDGYLRDPKVTVEVLTFRPFYILGEVNKPGEYPYSTGLTVLKAVAIAEGYTYRADQKWIFLKHPGDDKESRMSISGNIFVQPGDTIRVGERFF